MFYINIVVKEDEKKKNAVIEKYISRLSFFIIYLSFDFLSLLLNADSGFFFVVCCRNRGHDKKYASKVTLSTALILLL